MLRGEWLDVTALSRGTQNTMGRAQTGYYQQSCDSEGATINCHFGAMLRQFAYAAAAFRQSTRATYRLHRLKVLNMLEVLGLTH